MIRLHLSVDASGVPLFYSLFEKGVVLSTRTGCTLRDFLWLLQNDLFFPQSVKTAYKALGSWCVNPIYFSGSYAILDSWACIIQILIQMLKIS